MTVSNPSEKVEESPSSKQTSAASNTTDVKLNEN